jgi:hypothetical protein
MRSTNRARKTDPTPQHHALSVRRFSNSLLPPHPVSRHPPIRLATKTALAGGFAWAVAQCLNPHSRPYFAPIAAVLVVHANAYDSVSRALQRSVGVALGVAASLGVSRIFAPSVWSITLIIFLGLILGWSVGLGPRGVSQVPVSAFLVFLVGRATPGYGLDRITETLLGAAVAVVVVLLSPTVLRTDAICTNALRGLKSCSDVLRSISDVDWSSDELRDADDLDHRCVDAITQMAQSRADYEDLLRAARWNPRTPKLRRDLTSIEMILAAGDAIAPPIRAIACAMSDRSLHEPPEEVVFLLSSASAAMDAALKSLDAVVIADNVCLCQLDTMTIDTLARTLTQLEVAANVDCDTWFTLLTIVVMSGRILQESAFLIADGDGHRGGRRDQLVAVCRHRKATTAHHSSARASVVSGDTPQLARCAFLQSLLDLLDDQDPYSTTRRRSAEIPSVIDRQGGSVMHSKDQGH